MKIPKMINIAKHTHYLTYDQQGSEWVKDIDSIYHKWSETIYVKTLIKYYKIGKQIMFYIISYLITFYRYLSV